MRNIRQNTTTQECRHIRTSNKIFPLLMLSRLLNYILATSISFLVIFQMTPSVINEKNVQNDKEEKTLST